MLALTARFLVAGLALGACTFEAEPAPGVGDDPGADDDHGDGADPGDGTAQPATDDIVNVAAIDEVLGTGDLRLPRPAGKPAVLLVDTSALRVASGALPDGVRFVAAAQDGGGPELAILRVRKLTVEADVIVTGARPLVVIAEDIEISGRLDISAHHEPAAAGALSSSKGGALQLYARRSIASSGELRAGGAASLAVGDDAGAIVLQSPVIHNAGRLFANGDDGGPGGGDDDGQIVMLYRTKIARGMTTPTAITKTY